MAVHTLPSIVNRPKKRVGQGLSSGKGKTSGRGHKGDKARGRTPWWKAGGSRRNRLIKHLPTLRGLGNLNTDKKTVVITLSQLEKVFAANDRVTLESLVEKGLIKRVVEVKVLNRGNLTKPLTVVLPISQSAKDAIVKLGGTIE